jgi:hypothetical protein
MIWTRNARRGAGVAMALAFVAMPSCGDFLEVTDPGRFTDEALNTPIALAAVANGVEAELVQSVNGFASTFGLMSDEFMHTGTWQGDHDLNSGRSPSTLGGSGGFQSGLLSRRTAAQKAQERFLKVMPDSANRTVLMARMIGVEGWANVYMGMYNCESPKGPEGEIISDMEMFKLAIPLLTKAADVAKAAGNTHYTNWAIAGRARAKLFSGDLAGALADAQQIPDTWVNYARFSATNSNNGLAQLSYRTRLKAAGLDDRHWSKVDTVAGFFKDPYTGQLDRRLNITHGPNEKGADGVTQYYNQEKYNDLEDDIVQVSGWEMRLIEAEVYMKQGNLAQAMAQINKVRANAGLNPVTATTPEKVQEHLLWERFSQMYLEGMRMYDLHRFKLATAVLGPNRPTQYPLDGSEITLNPNVQGRLAGRCFPKS